MATYTERRGKITAQIRMKGHRHLSATFSDKTSAKAWAEKMQTEMREGKHLPSQESKRRTLAELIDRYVETVLPEKSESSQYGQGIQLKHWREQLGHMTLATVTPVIIADERDRLSKETTYRRTKRSPATVNRYLAALSHCLTYAQKELRWIGENPCRNVSKKQEPRGRVRFLSDDERAALLAACKKSRNKCLHDVVLLLLSTGARRKEITHLQWKHVDLDGRKITLDKTKNGEIRVIPLRGEAERVMQARSKIRRIDNPYVFPARYRAGREPRPVDIQTAWDLAVVNAKLTDFRMHDLRHSAASYLAMNGASLAELAEVLGHKTLQMVRRYTHLSETHTGDLLERMDAKIFGGQSDEKAEA